MLPISRTRGPRPRGIGTAARTAILGVILSLLCLSVVSSASASPTSLHLPEPIAFSILGASCGGIQEQDFATGFNKTSGHPIGAAYLQTRCSTGGRGGHTHTYSAWAAVTWDFAGAVSSYSELTSAPAGLSPTFSATDSHGDRIYNVLTVVNGANCSVPNTTYCSYRAYFTAVPPAPPTAVAAAQVGDQFRVRWTPAGTTAAVLTSSTVTATPVGSRVPALTATVSGSGTSALVGPLQPTTTYRITVVNADSGGTSSASNPISVSTPASKVPPSGPAGVSANWTAPQQPGDMLAASWNPAVPGDSPVDEYQIIVSVYDPGNPVPAPLSQIVSGSTLNAGFVVDDTLDWTTTVRAHNAAGWGPWSQPIVLPAA